MTHFNPRVATNLPLQKETVQSRLARHEIEKEIRFLCIEDIDLIASHIVEKLKHSLKGEEIFFSALHYTICNEIAKIFSAPQQFYESGLDFPITQAGVSAGILKSAEDTLRIKMPAYNFFTNYTITLSLDHELTKSELVFILREKRDEIYFYEQTFSLSDLLKSRL